MEALYFLNPWKILSLSIFHKDTKPSTDNSDTTKTNSITINTTCDENEEDSFFELELTVHDFDTTTNTADLSKRKILPIEPTSKPQSPTTSLSKSSPRFRVLMFRKSKSLPCRKEEKLETLENKLDVKEASSSPVLTRDNSLRKHLANDSLRDICSSKRFSKESIQKYLNLINPLNAKSNKQNGRTRFSGELSFPSPSSSPASAGSPRKEKQGNIPFRMACKHLGKSKSASVAIRASPPAVSKRDDSMELQNDGIQSAILHCKNSFNSSKDSSLLSRFASEQQEKSITSART